MRLSKKCLLSESLLMALSWRVSLFPLPAAETQKSTVKAGIPSALPGFALIPAGRFEMGDHHGFVDPKHGGDETPIHAVQIESFSMGI